MSTLSTPAPSAPASTTPVLREVPQSTFAEFALHPKLQAILATRGITNPTPIQLGTMPHLIAGRDVIGQARTGSGKTIAFAAPMVQRCDPNRRTVQGLVLVSTRELAIQVGEVVAMLAKPLGIEVTLLYGGHGLEGERRAIPRTHIVVGTPGRTFDHLQQGNLSLRDVRTLVLDEADEMLDKGFGPQVARIVAYLPRDRQTALFSATMPEWVRDAASRYLRDPITVKVDTTETQPAEIEHIIYDVAPELRFDALRTLLSRQGPDPIMVFGRTKHGVKKLARQLEAAGYSAGALQGNMSQNARERTMTDFRAGRLRILVATNVAARGLDIEGVEQVINYELPETPELFTHRVGRTGRMGRAGEAITLLSGEDALKWREFERALKRRFPRRQWLASDNAPNLPLVPVAPRPVAAAQGRPAFAPRHGQHQPAPAPRVAQHQPAPGSRPAQHHQPPAAGAPLDPNAPGRRRRFRRRGQGAPAPGAYTPGPPLR